MSSTSRSGSSSAAKCPPLGMIVWRRRLKARSIHSLGGAGAMSAGKAANAGRRLDPRALGQGARLLLGDAAIEPGRRAGRAGQPVDHDVVEQQVHREAFQRIAAAVAPALELLDDPGREADRRIGERHAQGLRPRRLDALVGGLVVERATHLGEPGLLGGAELRPSSRSMPGRSPIMLRCRPSTPDFSPASDDRRRATTRRRRPSRRPGRRRAGGS